jgi:hypothetical protein
MDDSRPSSGSSYGGGGGGGGGGMMTGRSDVSSAFSIEDDEYMFDDELLPEGWCRYFDDLSGQWYFVEMNTMRSTWVKPTESNCRLFPPITRAPKKKRDVPKTYQTSATQVGVHTTTRNICNTKLVLSINHLFHLLLF